VTWLFEILAATLGIILLWGLFAPRSQWQTLAGWSTSNPHTSEPGGGSYGVRRFLSGIGALGLAIVLALSSYSHLANQPQAAPPAGALEVMWGSPAPRVVDRLVNRLSEPPAGLVEVPVLGYQVIDEGAPPHYLAQLKPFSRLGKTDMPGYIGRPPIEGYSAADTAEILINVRGPVSCIPRAAVVIESEDTVQIAVYYGQPDAADGAAVDHVKGCPADSSVTASVLIPIDLGSPLAKRKLVALDGSHISRVLLVS
jgi:hypothetical protein